VVLPTTDTILADTIQALGRFKTTLRWKEEFRNQILKEQKKSIFLQPQIPLPTSTPTKTQETLETQEMQLKDHKMLTSDTVWGLGTSLKPERRTLNAPKGSDTLEEFLRQLEKTILDECFSKTNKENYEKLKKTNATSTQVLWTLEELKQSITVAVPMDKTNSYVLMEEVEYSNQMENHLLLNGTKITRRRVQELHKQASMMADIQENNLLLQERMFLKESIESWSIATAKLLVKDHKERNPTTGNYPTRLVIPAQNFAAGYSKLAVKGIEAVFKKNEINFQNKTITQASDMKEKVEKLGINKNKNTVMSFDAVDMYPSIKLDLINKAVKWYTRNLNREDQNKVKTCLELLKFGMNSTILAFKGQYYEYFGNNRDFNNKGLTIGGFESAFFADLVIAYLLEKAAHKFKDAIFYGIYRDDGILIFKYKITTKEATQWLEKFQQAIDEITGDNSLKFTISIRDSEDEMDTPTTPKK
jgi:hypothetical protein